jgi:hypothetical protein
MLNTEDYRNALSGEGPQAYDWSDKPHRLIYDLCNEVDRLQSQSAWQPIETAPKGVWVVVYAPRTKYLKPNKRNYVSVGGRQLVAKWHPYDGGNMMHKMKDHAVELGEKFGGFWTTHPNGRNPIIGMPTHWMPLPSPPEAE